MGGVRFETDVDTSVGAREKLKRHEIAGVPLRVEVGHRDAVTEIPVVTVVYRHSGEAETVAVTDFTAQERLDQIHEELFRRQVGRSGSLGQGREAEQRIVIERNEDGTLTVARVKQLADEGKAVLAPWCGSKESEKQLKEQTKDTTTNCTTEGLSASLKTLCMPLEWRKKYEAQLADGMTKCFITGEVATRWCLFGRSF